MKLKKIIKEFYIGDADRIIQRWFDDMQNTGKISAPYQISKKLGSNFLHKIASDILYEIEEVEREVDGKIQLMSYGSDSYFDRDPMLTKQDYIDLIQRLLELKKKK